MEPIRPRLKPTIELVPSADGRIYLLRGEVAGDIAMEDSPVARALLRGLDGRRPTHEVVDEVSAAVAIAPRLVRRGIAALCEAGVVEDAADDDDLPRAALERYDRQLRYFGDAAPLGASRAVYQARLQSARVVVLGVGGLGSWVALALASAGIGTLDLIDGDCVETDNLNRQVLFRECDVGEPKATSAARTLAGFNSLIEVRAHDRRLASANEIADAVDGADFVVEAADWPPHLIERWVNSACFERRIPFIAMSQIPPLVRIGPTYIPGETGCAACREEGYRERYPMYDELAAARGRTISPAATFGPACGFIGSLVATDVVHAVSGLFPPATLGCAAVVDLRTLETTREHVMRREGCAICANVPQVSQTGKDPLPVSR